MPGTLKRSKNICVIRSSSNLLHSTGTVSNTACSFRDFLIPSSLNRIVCLIDHAIVSSHNKLILVAIYQQASKSSQDTMSLPLRGLLKSDMLTVYKNAHWLSIDESLNGIIYDNIQRMGLCWYRACPCQHE